jgi:hypothetical protein
MGYQKTSKNGGKVGEVINIEAIATTTCIIVSAIMLTGYGLGMYAMFKAIKGVKNERH